VTRDTAVEVADSGKPLGDEVAVEAVPGAAPGTAREFAADSAPEPLAPASVPRALGDTGVIVSPVGLDGAVFGWASGVADSARSLEVYVEAGGNLISTADHYAGGRSEIMIGSWLRGVADRSSLVIETRVGKHPDAVGLSKRSILRAVENSLTRLGTDYVDFLSFDGEDPQTPIEDSLETGQRLISEGKVRFLSAFRVGAGTIRDVQRLADDSGVPRFRALLVEYNLMERERYETDIQPIAVELGRGALARLPLAQGYLTGEYRAREETPRGFLFDDAARHVGRRGDRILAALGTVAKELGETPTTIALAWVLVKPGIASAILRATDAEDLSLALRAVNVRLARHHVALLDRVSAA
jgi:aryl-alcohol dehydrogenase-like predicted oxidoreductase